MSAPILETSSPSGVQATARPRSAMASVFLTAFLDLVGFSIIFPLFPKMLDHYLALEGAESLIGHLAAALRSFAGSGPRAEFQVVALFGGVIGSLYSLLQFAFAPLWGSLSDRIGRRPTLLLTLGGTLLGYLSWFFAGSFGLLIASRMVGGLMAGNLSTVSAVVADTTAPHERSKGMGILGMAIGMGFIIGPALGGLSSLLRLDLMFPALTELGVNPFSGPALLALSLSALNLIVATLRFPETLPPERRGQVSSARTANPLRIFFGAVERAVKQVNAVYFLFLTAFSAMEFSLTFLAVERFSFTPRQNAMMFVYVGLLIATVQGGVVRRLAPRFGDRRLSTAGIVILLPGFLLVGLAGSVPLLYFGLFFMACGSALATPCLGALVSQYAPAEQQGLALGTFRSMGALSRAVGPVLGGLLYFRFGSASPYLTGAVFLLLPAVISISLPEPTKH